MDGAFQYTLSPFSCTFTVCEYIADEMGYIYDTANTQSYSAASRLPAGTTTVNVAIRSSTLLNSVLLFELVKSREARTLSRARP